MSRITLDEMENNWLAGNAGGAMQLAMRLGRGKALR